MSNDDMSQAHLFFSDKTILTEHKSYYRSLCIFFVFVFFFCFIRRRRWERNLMMMMYKDYYISKSWFCFALCVFVSSNRNFFFFSSAFPRTKLIVEWLFVRNPKFFCTCLSLQNSKARLFRRETRALFLATVFEEFASSFEERSPQTKVFFFRWNCIR